jgi:2-dehydro-3-deoxygalactonokinase
VASSIPKGASAELRAREFQTVLARQISLLPDAGPILETEAPVIVSGMASSSIGWMELPYAAVPFAVDGSQARCEWLKVAVSEFTLPVLLVSGLATATEMMRGEETQVIGLLAQTPDCVGDSLIVLPGTHSKHVRVRDGNIVGLQTFMTGELFDVLSRHSVLRFTTDANEDVLDEPAFLEGVEAANTVGLMKALFQARSRGVLRGTPASANRAFLSGLLIGAELREGLAGSGVPRILLAASDPVATLYQRTAARLNFHLETVREWQHAAVRGHAIVLNKSARPGA